MDRIKVGGINLYVDDQLEDIQALVVLPEIRKIIYNGEIFIFVKDAFKYYFKVKKFLKTKPFSDEEFMNLDSFFCAVQDLPHEKFKRFKENLELIKMTTGCDDIYKIFINARQLYANMTLDDLEKSLTEHFRLSKGLNDDELAKALARSIIKRLELLTLLSNKGYEDKELIAFTSNICRWFDPASIEAATQYMQLLELCKQAAPKYGNFESCDKAFKEIFNVCC